MIRVVPFAKSEISFDPREAGRALSKSLERYPGFRFACVVPMKDEVLILLEEAFDDTVEDGEFIFSPMNCGENTDEIVSNAVTRYMGGYSTRGTFHIGPTRWGLFFRPINWRSAGR